MKEKIETLQKIIQTIADRILVLMQAKKTGKFVLTLNINQGGIGMSTISFEERL